MKIHNLPYSLRLILALFGMARPMQLVAVTLVYTLGTLMALTQDIALNEHVLIWGYVALIPTAMSIHYANEYADYETDHLAQRTPFSGGSGALVRTGLSRNIAIYAARFTLALGSSIWSFAFLLDKASLTSGGVLMFGAFFGWMYSLAPLKLAWRGWGELDNAMLGGVALPVYGYAVQAEMINGQIILFNLPFGLLVFINLLATTWADREPDAAVGKYTLATDWDITHLRRLYLSAGIFSFLVSASLLATQSIPNEVGWVSLGIFPLMLIGAWTYTRIHTPFPTVFTMIVMLVGQIIAWGSII